MEKLAFYDIDKILTEIADRKSSGFELNDLLDSDINNRRDLKATIEDPFHDDIDRLGDFEIVGTDDSDRDGYDTEQIFRVFHFTDHNVYVKIKGFWNSYGGNQFESMKEVKPTTKTVTVYE